MKPGARAGSSSKPSARSTTSSIAARDEQRVGEREAGEPHPDHVAGLRVADDRVAQALHRLGLAPAGPVEGALEQQAGPAAAHLRGSVSSQRSTVVGTRIQEARAGRW